MCGKSDFPCHKELLLKERIHSLWEQILSFKGSSHYENVGGLQSHWYTVNPVLSGHSKEDPKICFQD